LFNFEKRPIDKHPKAWTGNKQKKKQGSICGPKKKGNKGLSTKTGEEKSKSKRREVLTRLQKRARHGFVGRKHVKKKGNGQVNSRGVRQTRGWSKIPDDTLPCRRVSER